MRFGRVALILAAIVLVSFAVAQDEFWLPRYDEANTGVSGDSLKLPVSLQWKHSTGDEVAIPVAMPAVGSEMIYAPVGPVIYALDRTTGELRWSQEAGADIYSSPALSGDTLYYGSRDNSVWAVNAADGEVMWRYPTGGAVDCSPVVVGNMLYIGSDDNRLTAINLDTREAVWQFETSGDIKASPLVYRDVVLVGSQDRHIYCLNSQGRPMWTKSTTARAFFAAPTGERTKVIYACGKELIAREIYTGRRLWRFQTAGIISGSPCVRDRKVYIGTAAGALYAIDANTGRGLWKYPADGVTEAVTSSPTVVDDMLVFRAGARQISAISLRDGTQRWSFLLPEPPEKKAAAAGGGAMGDPMMGPEGGMFPGEGDPGAVIEGPVAGGDINNDNDQRADRKYEMADNVDPAIAVSGNSVYVVGDDNVVYGFAATSADNVPPVISDAILEVPGKGRQRVNFSPNVTSDDDFEGRYADEIVIPGTPPIFLSMLVRDEGSGIDADKVRVLVDGEAIDDFAYDPKEGVLWYIYDPRGAAMNLANGVRNIVFEATDWRGNRAGVAVSFTIDNKAQPPEPPQPKQPEMGGMGMEFGPEGFDPGFIEPPPPPM